MNSPPKSRQAIIGEAYNLSAQIIRGVGTTESERYLSSLAERTFLNLWSYPNTYISKKVRGQGDGKELADLLVVFGDDVIVFSDKSIGWPAHSDLQVAWRRWHKSAVKKSVEQVQGAVRMLREHPEMIFLDKNCTQQFPYKIPESGSVRFHGVCVALGAEEPCRRHFGDNLAGFAVSSPSISVARTLTPFTFGDENPGGVFCHIFDKEALDAVMSEFDTAADLVRYLSCRSDVIRSGRILFCPNERELVAFYRQNTALDGSCSFGWPACDPTQAIVIQEGFHERLISRPEYVEKNRANEVSYFWDRLIENFTKNVINGTHVSILGEPPSAADAEPGLRLMASETRVMRRALSSVILEAKEQAERQAVSRFARVVMPEDDVHRDRVSYVFLVMKPPKVTEENDEYRSYRDLRATVLLTYCEAILERYRNIETAVGIAIDLVSDPHGEQGRSEDLIAVQVSDWSEEAVTRLRERCEALGVFSDPRQTRSLRRFEEYPNGSGAAHSRQVRRAMERRQKKRSGSRVDS